MGFRAWDYSVPSAQISDKNSTNGQAVQDESLKNVMLSWYYAGYYTGLYEGQQNRAAAGSSKEKKKPQQ